MTKTLIFDLGKVIVPFDFNHAYARMEALSGLPREEIRERITSKKLHTRLESGEIAPLDFLAEMNRLLGTSLAYPEFQDVWVSIFDRQALIPESLFAAVKERYRLLLLSNTNAIHFEWLSRSYPHFEHFDRWVLSYEVGAQKPDPRIYREVLEHAECEPAECFFTDDIPEYVEGARKHGIDAVQFTGYESLRGHLAERGISV